MNTADLTLGNPFPAYGQSSSAPIGQAELVHYSDIALKGTDERETTKTNGKPKYPDVPTDGVSSYEALLQNRPRYRPVDFHKQAGSNVGNNTALGQRLPPIN
jgi:hypothetical protein